MTQSTLGFRPATKTEVAGHLKLTVVKFDDVTRPLITEHFGVMRLMQPLYLDDSGQLTYIIVNPGVPISARSMSISLRWHRERICSLHRRVQHASTKRRNIPPYRNWTSR